MQITKLMGPIASGKTTYALDLLRQHPEMVYVNRDNIRTELPGGYPHCDVPYQQLPQDHPVRVAERKVRYTVYEMVFKAVTNGQSVLIDETNLNQNRRQWWRQMIEDVSADRVPPVTLVIFETIYPCIARRGYSAKEWENIREQMQYEPLSDEEMQWYTEIVRR